MELLILNLAMRVPEIDTHTHTVVSGHAWSTLTENVNSARQKGLKGICLTEHGPDMPQGAPGYTPLSQTMIPQEIDGDIGGLKRTSLTLMDALISIMNIYPM